MFQIKNSVYKKFELIPIANGLTFNVQNCFYNPLTKHAHILIDFACDTSATMAVLAKVPNEVVPLNSFWGIAYKVNGNSTFGTTISINSAGEIKQGLTSSLTSGVFEFDYIIR